MAKETVAILVGGGPAPGINGVIAAATIEAINRGCRVIGIYNGFERLMKGDTGCARELSTSDVSTIHNEGGSILRTSRANPTKDPNLLKAVVATLQSLGVSYLVTIGGDDTATSAQAVSVAAGGSIKVAHVPKTIDNDLPLPEKYSTFGFETAREAGTEIAKTLSVDAKTTSRWYLMVAMGRKAGHLALGIGISSGATLTLIPEEFPRQVPLPILVNIIVGSILKRMAMDRPYGVVVLAEGLAEKVDPTTLPDIDHIERDPHGHIRYAELDFAGILKKAVRARLAQLGVSKLTIVEKNVGYELRCQAPNSFDREYTRLLGFGAVDFLLNGGSGAMISRQRDSLVPIPFAELIDPDTKRAKVRFVDTSSVVYQVAQKYMIKLRKRDLEDGALLEKMASVTSLKQEELTQAISQAAAAASGYGLEFVQ